MFRLVLLSQHIALWSKLLQEFYFTVTIITFFFTKDTITNWNWNNSSFFVSYYRCNLLKRGPKYKFSCDMFTRNYYCPRFILWYILHVKQKFISVSIVLKSGIQSCIGMRDHIRFVYECRQIIVCVVKLNRSFWIETKSY